MNTINQRQNHPAQLARLSAQRTISKRAKRWLGAQALLSVLGAVVWAFIVLRIPDLKVYAAAWGALVTIFSIILFEPFQRTLKREAAGVKEQFDCYVLSLDWNKVHAGREPPPELVTRNARKPDRLLDWYPDVARLPLATARIVCQRTNCWWDASVRRHYAYGILATIAFCAVLVVLLGLLGGLALEGFVLSVVVPLLPVLYWGAREVRDHFEAAATSDRHREALDDLWALVLKGEVSDVELQFRSRALQDEIYDRRRRSPQVFDTIHWRLRPGLEAEMKAAAEQYVEQALAALAAKLSAATVESPAP